MRAFTVLLFCLSIALQGIASTHVFDKPCPMEQGTATGMMSDSGVLSDCCNDAETAAKTGKLCKTGQECSVSSIFLIASLQSPSQEYTATAPFEAGGSFLPSFNPYDIWRPPTLS